MSRPREDDNEYDLRTPKKVDYGDKKVYGDAAVYQTGSHERYNAYMKMVSDMSCDADEAREIYLAFDDGFKGVSKGGKGKIMKGGDVELINKVVRIGQRLRDLLMPESVSAAIPDRETIFNDFKNLADGCQKELVSFLIRNKIIESSLEYGSKFVAILLFTQDSIVAGSLLIQEFLDRNNITFNNTRESVEAFSKLIFEKVNKLQESHATYVSQQNERVRQELIEMIEEMKKGLPGSEERVEQEEAIDKMESDYEESELKSMEEKILKIQKKKEFIDKKSKLLKALNAAKEELEEANKAQAGLKVSADMNIEGANGGRKTRKGGRKCRKSRKGNCKIKVKSRKNKRRSNKKKYNNKYNKK
tara:strand:+ start:1022 stop:2101 length:1080 start_codon:yes stop_codon:yes gene_type:complete